MPEKSGCEECKKWLCLMACPAVSRMLAEIDNLILIDEKKVKCKDRKYSYS